MLGRGSRVKERYILLHARCLLNDVLQVCGAAAMVICALQMSLLDDSLHTACDALAEGIDCAGKWNGRMNVRAGMPSSHVGMPLWYLESAHGFPTVLLLQPTLQSSR